nr:protein phosphatase 2C 6 [Tanacetum cinerariifolium]
MERLARLFVGELTGDRGVDRLPKNLSHLTTHFVRVYDGHGGCQTDHEKFVSLGHGPGMGTMLAGVAAAAYRVHQMTSSYGHGCHNVSHGANNMMVPMVAALDNHQLLRIRDEIEKEEEIEKMRPNVKIEEKL